ncbi:uncharacterized protein LOC143371826 isoform X2 [Andrena cerasifolii]|uniref:uncharacterized protein LOC143371826 isoform X2 n=1 Tax=Andrena cerasifolii TaxID=2819439 RepID=UPI00403818BD
MLIIVGFKHNAEYKVSTEVLKERQRFWDNLCNSYSKPFLSDIEYNITTLRRCKSLNFIQYWINTGNLPYKAMMEDATNPEGDMSFREGQSSYSSLLDNVKEKPNGNHERLISDENSLSSSIDTAAYILSNTNTTNKIETMAIVEGAKHGVSPNQKNHGNVGTVQFETTVLDNNGNACQASLPTTSSNPTESLTQQATNNLHKSIIKTSTDPVNRDNAWNCTSEHSGELFNAEYCTPAFNASRYSNPDIRRMYCGKLLLDESSTLEDNTTKSSSRKKLYTGRDSPVDLANMTSSKKIMSTNSTKNLHPALHPTCKTSKKYLLYRKRQISRFSIFNKSMLNSSILSISNYRKRKRRKIAQSHVSENSSIMDASKKRRNKVDDKTVNNPSTTQRFTESALSEELLTTKSKLDNSVAQVEKLVNQLSEKSNHASRTYLNPSIYLIPVTERDIQKYRSSKKTTASLRGLCPVVRLIQLSESDIEEYRKANREATRPGSLSPIVHLKQPSEFNNPERRKSQDAFWNARFRHPVVRLKKLSELDIKKYKAELVRSEHSGTAYVPQNSSKCSNISKPRSKAAHLIGDESMLLMDECQNSASQDRSSRHTISIAGRQPSSPVIGASENCSLVRKDTSDKYAGSNKNDMYETLETAQKGFCINSKVDSSSNSSCTVEKRLLQKNLKTNVSCLKASNSVLPEEGPRQNHEAISCSDESEIFNKDCRSNGAYASRSAQTNRKSYNLLLSDEDDEFVNLIYNSEQKRNAKIRSPYNSPRKNSDDPVEIRNEGKCTTKSVKAKLPPESIGQNGKFAKQTGYIYRKRRSKNLLYLSEEENINHANPVSITRSNLTTRIASGYKSNDSQIVLRDRRKLLTRINIKGDKSRLRTLRFQTKVFDSDSESSYFS